LLIAQVSGKKVADIIIIKGRREDCGG